MKMKTYHLIQTTLAAVASILFIGAAAATPPNTTAANAVPYEVGQGWVTHYFDEATQSRWFKYGEVGGHSYCIEAVQGSVSTIQLDPNIAVFADTTGSAALSISGAPLTNNDGGGSPNFVKGSRICYISPIPTFGTTNIRGVKISVPIVSNSTDAGFLKFRIVDTTLTSPFPYYANFNGYLTNHSPATLQYRISHVSINFNSEQGDSSEGSHVGSIGGYRSAALYISTAFTNTSGGTSYRNGVIYVAHDAPPGRVGLHSFGGDVFRQIR
jgi:hypothetical protein